MRFHEDEDGDDLYGGEFFEEADESDFYEHSREYKIAELAIVEGNIQRKLLISTIRMLEKSFFWRFYSLKTKLNMIRETYQEFKNLWLGENNGDV